VAATFGRASWVSSIYLTADFDESRLDSYERSAEEIQAEYAAGGVTQGLSALPSPDDGR
jgi:hypothetical protein